jgi:hypothetical protein
MYVYYSLLGILYRTLNYCISTRSGEFSAVVLVRGMMMLY